MTSPQPTEFPIAILDEARDFLVKSQTAKDDGEHTEYVRGAMKKICAAFSILVKSGVMPAKTGINVEDN